MEVKRIPNLQGKKNVSFDLKPTVYIMHVWKYAYRAARYGEWEEVARDRERFKMKIDRLSGIINPILIKKYVKFNSE